MISRFSENQIVHGVVLCKTLEENLGPGHQPASHPAGDLPRMANDPQLAVGTHCLSFHHGGNRAPIVVGRNACKGPAVLGFIALPKKISQKIGGDTYRRRGQWKRKPSQNMIGVQF